MASTKNGKARLTRKRWAIASLLTVALFFGGCVYMQLLITKRQLSDFDEYVEVRYAGEELTFEFVKPHLTGNSLNELGVWPVETTETDNGTIWKTGFEKLALGEERNPEHDLWLNLVIRDGLLTEIRIPEKYIDAFTAPVITDVARSLGESKISGLRKVISVDWSSDRAQVDGISPGIVESVLGKPHERETDRSESYVTYRYRKPEILSDDEAGKVYTIRFHFDDRKLVGLMTRALRIDFAGS